MATADPSLQHIFMKRWRHDGPADEEPQDETPSTATVGWAMLFLEELRRRMLSLARAWRP